MQFMTSVHKTTGTVCGYYINGKRVSRDVYEYWEIYVGMWGRFYSLTTTEGKSTYQYRTCGSI